MSQVSVMHEGWLIRERSFLKGGNQWSFVVLDSEKLSYYKDEKKTNINTSVIPLNRIRACRQQGPVVFQLDLDLNVAGSKEKKKQKVTFRCRTEAEKNSWTFAIGALLGEIPPSYKASRSTLTSVASSVLFPKSKQSLSVTRSQPVLPKAEPQSPTAATSSNMSPSRTEVTQVTSPQSAGLEPGTRVRLGSIDRFGVIERASPASPSGGQFLVRVEGKSSVLLPLSANLLSPCQDARREDEAPPPQFLASSSTRKMCRKEQKESAKALRQLMVEVVTAQICASATGEDADCAICTAEYEVGEKRLRLPCLHVFHDGCVRPWLSEKSECCPVCNTNIIKALADMSMET